MMPSVTGLPSALKSPVGDSAGVEHHRAARVHDQVRRVHEVDFAQLFALEVEHRRVEAANGAVVEHVDARRAGCACCACALAALAAYEKRCGERCS